MSNNLAIYVHWPFCVSKCPYCDFNSFVSDDIDHDKWLKSYKLELEYYYDMTKGREVTSIFFGGGTPSLMKPFIAEGVINKIASLWGVSDDVEISLEANPSSVEYNKFKDFAVAGINRVSIGVQSFDDVELKFLGRKHSADEAIQAIKTAQKCFDRYSFDLIYALPEQSAVKWKSSLSNALEYAEGHISMYQLTIEKGTEFFTRHSRGDFSVPDGDKGGALYEITQLIMEEKGFPAYEISNHARQGEESKHNMVYWRYGDYVGVGPGAHGRLTIDGVKKATRAHRAPEIWMDKVFDKKCGSHDFENVSAKERAVESLMMGLRLKEGVPLSRIEYESGGDWQKTVDPKKLYIMQEEGFIRFDGKIIRPSIKGFQRLDAILSFIIV